MRRHGERLRFNVRACRGRVLMVTLTAPGVRGGCPWDPAQCRVREPHEHAGHLGCRVEALSAELWNDGMFDAWQRLHRKARERASRRVSGCGSRLLAKSPELQVRGVLHLHVLFGAATSREVAWVDAYVAALRALAGSERFGEQLRVGDWGPASDAGGYVAKYVSKTEGMRQWWEDGRLPARAFYVSSGLTMRTGVTMRTLKRQGRCWYDGVVVPTMALGDLVAFERSLGRELTVRELVGLPGARRRGP